MSAFRHGRRAGFSLVELLLVMVLIAILAGIAGPAFVGLGRGTGLSGSVRNMADTISLARQWAITHKETVTFVCEAGNTTNPSCFYLTNLLGQIGDKQKLPMSIKTDIDDDDQKTIEFKPDGGVGNYSGSEPIQVVIKERKTENPLSRTIQVNFLTGGIKVTQ